MTTTYHAIHFVPDIGVQSRHLLGLLLNVSGDLRWIDAPLPPLEEMLSPEKHHLLQAVLAAVRQSPAAALPQVPFSREERSPRHSGFGNHFLISAPRAVPDGVGAEAWVRAHCLPKRPRRPARLHLPYKESASAVVQVRFGSGS